MPQPRESRLEAAAGEGLDQLEEVRLEAKRAVGSRFLGTQRAQIVVDRLAAPAPPEPLHHGRVEELARRAGTARVEQQLAEQGAARARQGADNVARDRLGSLLKLVIELVLRVHQVPLRAEHTASRAVRQADPAQPLRSVRDLTTAS